MQTFDFVLHVIIDTEGDSGLFFKVYNNLKVTGNFIAWVYLNGLAIASCLHVCHQVNLVDFKLRPKANKTLPF